MKGAAIIKQKGQAAVEFAFIAALFMCIVLGMIYGGILFMDYLQYNNDARAIAREVAFMKDENFTDNKLTAEKTKELADRYFKNRTDMYTATLAPPEKKIEIISEDEKIPSIQVEISFKLNGTWGLSNMIGFPPKSLNPIVYIMPIEKEPQTNTSE